MISKELEKLLQLNKDMDEIIAKAKIETHKMEAAVEEIIYNAVESVFDALRDIEPAMDAICSFLRVNEYQEKMIFSKKHGAYHRYILLFYGNPDGANYGIKITYHDSTVQMWNGRFIVTSTSDNKNHDVIINDTRQFIVEYYEDIIIKLNQIVEKLLLETIENKGRQQVETQHILQEKLKRIGGYAEG